MKYDVWYIFCYSEKQFKNALERLKISISSIKNVKNIKILTWHKTLKKEFSLFENNKYIQIFFTEKRVFSKSYFINQIAKIVPKKNKYFYLSDTDLFFHPEYFKWLEYICKKLNYEKGDLRLITSNYNIRPQKIYKFIPSKLFNFFSTYFPYLYKWTTPKNLNEILGMEFAKKDYAHGCGLIPIDPLKKIGGYNEEIIGYGPEDDLFNQRIKFFSRVYYHKGNLRSSTFHIFHSKLNYQNKKKNWIYWNKIINDIATNKIHSDYILRK